MWTNALRLIDEDGLALGELRARARAYCNVGGLERWGWIQVGDGVTPRREGYGTSRGLKPETILAPTRAGAYARRLWPRVIEEVEGRWRERFGAARIEALRSVLRTAPNEMPWSPPEVAPSDGFYTAVIAGGHIVAGGDVVASGGIQSDERPLPALLGQALTARTLELERAPGIRSSLPLAANLLRVLSSGGARKRDLVALTGLSKEGVAMSVSYVLRAKLATETAEGVIRLTARGNAALAAHEARSGPDPDDGGLRTALIDVLSQTTALSSGLVPPPGCWRGESPYLARTERFIADPLGTLPHHPMILHRGAWPDAS
jgi:hypothetical protein